MSSRTKLCVANPAGVGQPIDNDEEFARRRLLQRHARPGSARIAQLEDSPIGLGSSSRPIEMFFKPHSVAVVGASEHVGSAGRLVLANLTKGFTGAVYAVNPDYETVLGLPSFPTLEAVRGRVDLAVIATPAQAVPDIISACVAKGVKGAIVLSGGFDESGAAGAALKRDLLSRAVEGQLRVLGPNCLGSICAATGLNASVATMAAPPGTVGFASQSGALCCSILDWSVEQRFGFSAFVSMGEMIDVSWSDVIYYLGDDPATKSIVLYIESVGDARAFLSAAREVALVKPIVLIKAGRTSEAAGSHTRLELGSDDVLDAAFERSGVLRVDSIEELFSMAKVLSEQPRPAGKRLAIVTNAGGPGVVATDALVVGGGKTARLGEPTLARLGALLPSRWSQGDPIDIGEVAPERYAETIEIVAADSNNDGVLVTCAPQAGATTVEIAQHVANIQKPRRKPILASWMGGDEAKAGAAILERASIPTFAYPDTAARIFNLMCRYDTNVRLLLETPTLEHGYAAPDRGAARAVIAGVLAQGRAQLTETEAKRVLAAYGIPTVPGVVAASAEEAVAAAGSLGYPVAVKVHSASIRHKTDVGGVRLRVGDARAVRRAFEEIGSAIRARLGAAAFQGVTVQPMIDAADGCELIVASAIDRQFGPVLLFGHGGELADVVGDRVLGLPPLTETLARRMIEKPRISRAFDGVRGRQPIDRDALARCLLRFSDLIVEQPRIKQIVVNPLLATPERVAALDAHMVLHASSVCDDALPRTAIRPYPSQYDGTWTARDGSELAIRSLRPEDEPLMRRFHTELSDESVYLRYARPVQLAQRISHDKLARLCFIDYAHEMALIVLRTDSAGEQAIVGIARLIMEHERNEAEFALAISDSVQGNGLGTELLRRLIEIGQRERVGRIVGYILANNRRMLDICRNCGFRFEHEVGDPLVTAIEDLE